MLISCVYLKIAIHKIAQNSWYGTIFLKNILLEKALDNGTLKTAVAGVDKSSGHLIITPVSVFAK